MARAKKTASIGHNNAPLDDDEIAALQLWFSTKIREARKEADAAKAVLDSKREVVNGFFSQARGELRLTRKEFEEVLALQDMTESEFLNHEAKRSARMRLQGLPVGEQIELPLGDTADDLAQARANGFRAGMRGEPGEPPETVSPVCHQDWMGGWIEGQAKLAEGMFKAEGILEKIKASQPEPESKGEVVGDDEPEQEDLEEAIDAAARKLKRGGFLKPAPETVGDDAPAETDKAA